jgi:multidrug transporter EmrE-like cation transporter
MEARTARRGEIIAGVSGVALIIIMFLKWWEIDLGADFPAAGFEFDLDTSFNAWQLSDFNDVIWFITALLAIALGLVALSQASVNLPVALSAVVAGLALLSLVLLVIRLLDPPGEVSRAYGVWLGLLAIIGILYGAWETMQEEAPPAPPPGGPAA